MLKWFLAIGLTFIVLFLFQSCKSSKQDIIIPEGEAQFSLVKGACFGSCPVYELKVYSNGKATYLGQMHTEMQGLYTKKVNKDLLKKIKKQFGKSVFDQYPKMIESRIPDLPMVTVGYHNGDQYMEVSGREDRPEELMQLQFLLEKVADSDGWILAKSEAEMKKGQKPAPSIIYKEIIIETAPGTQMARWIESMDQYGVRLIKKLAPNLNIYLITYTHSTITPQQMIKLLRAEEKIISAEFNQKVTKRGR